MKVNPEGICHLKINIALAGNVLVVYVAHMVNMNLTGDQLIPTQEAARILGVSVATMNRYAATGEVVVAVKSPGKRGANLYERSYIERIEREARRSQKAGA